MLTLKDWIVGICISSGIILIFLGVGAVWAGNGKWPVYLVAGAVIAGAFVKIAINDYKRSMLT
jgi:hypothetical protein